MILKASISDLDEIHSLTKSCAKYLIEMNIFQWNDMYPSVEVLKNDVKLNQLWKFVENEIIVGILVLTEIEDLEYNNVNWLTANCKVLYVHRLAVHPNFQGKGFAKKLMSFAENYATKQNFKSVRLDTFSQNKKNQIFYKNRGYKKLESIYFLNQSEFPFYCYEKVLDA